MQRLLALMTLLTMLFSVPALGADAERMWQPDREDYKPQIDWSATADAPGYDQATAHEPQFDDKAIWPQVTGKEEFLKGTWSGGHTYVWANPGINSQARRNKQGPDPFDPASWLENGKTPQSVVFGQDTDLVFPPSDKRYSVDLSGEAMRNAGFRSEFRHLTVGRNAHLSCGGDGAGRRHYGHVWIKHGGSMGGNGEAKFVGDQPAFFRCDTDPGLQKIILSQYFGFAKNQEVTTEVLGRVDMLDEFSVDSPLIIGPDSRMHPGRAARPRIGPHGTLILLDGAFFASWTNYLESPDLTVKGGTVQGGLPDRPLTRNAFLGLSYKNYTNAVFEHGDTKVDCRFVPSAMFEKGSTIRTISKDIEKARLVICWNNFLHGAALGRTRWETVDGRYQKALKVEAERLFMVWFESLPKFIDISFGDNVTIDGVEFDYMHAGSLRTTTERPLTQWKRIYFGPHCQATGDEAAGPPSER